MDTLSALLACCAGETPVTSGLPPQMVSNFDDSLLISFAVSLGKRLNKQSR